MHRPLRGSDPDEIRKKGQKGLSFTWKIIRSILAAGGYRNTSLEAGGGEYNRSPQTLANYHLSEEPIRMRTL